MTGMLHSFRKLFCRLDFFGSLGSSQKNR